LNSVGISMRGNPTRRALAVFTTSRHLCAGLRVKSSDMGKTSTTPRAGDGRPLKSGAPVAPGPQYTTVHQADLVRVAAMVAIFFHHLWAGLPLPLAADTLGKCLNAVFSQMSLGVVFFNFLSGFLLALPHLGAASRPLPRYSEFLRKRFLRIVPPYYIAVFLITVGNIAIYRLDIRGSAISLLKLLLFAHSWDWSVFNTDYAALWYLGPLAQFYLCFPLILRLFYRLGARNAVISAVVASYGACWLMDLYLAAVPGSILSGPGRMLLFNLPGRLPEFAMGMWFAAVWRPDFESTRQTARESGFSKFFSAALLFAAAATVAIRIVPFPIPHMAQVAWCFLLFVPVLVLPGAARWADWRIVKSFSAASYSFYLLHQPLLTWLRFPMPAGFGRMGQLAVRAAVMIPVVFLCAMVLDRAAGAAGSRIAKVWDLFAAGRRERASRTRNTGRS
jgi:peptidoglycan/LPS O-acetylase OafA/YrhL